jgi:hypothetical protein
LPPNQLRAAFVISPPATMKACSTRTRLPISGREYLVSQHHRDLIVDLGEVEVGGLAGSGRIQFSLLGLDDDVEYMLGGQWLAISPDNGLYNADSLCIEGRPSTNLWQPKKCGGSPDGSAAIHGKRNAGDE